MSLDTIKFGWKRDLPDIRDFKYKVTVREELPTKVDLRGGCTPVYNQLSLGSCTANALAAAVDFERIRQGKMPFSPSRLFIYYNEREIEGTVKQDSGAMIRTGIKTLAAQGACPEEIWKYRPIRFRRKPDPLCYEKALETQILEYSRITPHNSYEVKHCLADGHPVVFGFMIYNSFMADEVARTGMAPIPSLQEQPVGGHAVLAVGYDEDKQCLIIRNSWGTGWGIKGYFYMPYWYVDTPNVSADYWTIKLVE